MPNEEKRYSDLARKLKYFDYAIIDTCSLMEENFPEWLNVFEKTKKEYLKELHADFQLYVPYKCYEELKKHAKIKSKNRDLLEKKVAAKRAIRIVRWAKLRKILVVTKKDKNDKLADNAITIQVIHDRLDKRILVITQDKGLASDLLYWNHSKSQFGKEVSVYQIVSGGNLAPNRGKPNIPPKGNPNNNAPSVKPKPQPKSQQTPYDVIEAEKRLRALLSNPNYPLEKKKKIVQTHLDALLAMPKEKRTSLNLYWNIEALKGYLATGIVPAQSKNTPAALEKPNEALEQEPSYEGAVKSLKMGEAMTIKEALSQSASKLNLMFRYHSIPYNPQFHGPVDFTSKDLDAFALLIDKSLKSKGISMVVYKEVVAYAEARNLSFRVWLDISSIKLPSKPVEKKKKPAKTASNEESVEASIPVQPVVEEKKPVKTPSPKKKSASSKKKQETTPIKKEEVETPKLTKPASKKKKKEPVQVESTPSPVEAPLPNEDKPILPKKEEKPSAPKKGKKKPASKPQSPKKEKQPEQPAKAPLETPETASTEQPAKPSTPKKAKKEKPVSSEETSKTSPTKKAKKGTSASNAQEPPAPKKEPAKKANTPKKKVEADPALLEETLKADRNLGANFNNPTYPETSKINDLKAQLNRIKKLSPAQKKSLSFSSEAVKKMLDSLTKK